MKSGNLKSFFWRMSLLMPVLMLSITLFSCIGKTDGSSAPGPSQTAKEPAETGTVPEIGVDETRPCFSEETAFRTERTDITVTVPKPKTETYEIYYTLDGSSPKTGGKLLKAGEKIKLMSGVDGVIAARPVRAIAKYSDGSWSRESVKTYFLGKNVNARFDTKVISISVEPEEFYGKDGIYTNYEQKGKAWERACYFEVLDADGTTLLSQHSGIRIHGGWTRARSMKSLRIYARADYDPNHGSFDYAVFDGATDQNGKAIGKYKRFVLRNSGNDQNNTFVRDALAQTLAKEAGFTAYEEVTPATVYINGKYQGLYWLQEYVDEHYFASKFGAYKGEFEKSEHKEYAVDTEERNLEFPEFSSLDLTNDKNFEKVKKAIDIDDYLFYYAINTILDNEDWPQTNSISYRYIPADGESYGEGVFDGRWRFMIHDEDMTLGLGSNHPTRECLKCILDPEAVVHHSETLDLIPYSPLFAALMKREDMRTAFAEKVKSLVNGVFSAEHISETLERLTESERNELGHYYTESPHKGDQTWDKYQTKLQKLKDNAVRCQESILKQMKDLWGID